MGDIRFGERGFRSLCVLAAEAGYSFVVPGELDVQRPLFLRHDVDLSIEAAAELARIEGELGVRATYLVMLRSDFYSLADRAAVEFFAVLEEHNHHLGIHFDPAVYGRAGADLERAIDREIEIVEWLARRAPTAFSVHQPTLNGMVGPSDDSILHMHGEHMGTRFDYVSDSCMEWRHPPEPILERGQPLQMLLHPEYWVSTASSLAAVVERLAAADAQRLLGRYDCELRLMEDTVRRRAELDGHALRSR